VFEDFESAGLINAASAGFVGPNVSNSAFLGGTQSAQLQVTSSSAWAVLGSNYGVIPGGDILRFAVLASESLTFTVSLRENGSAAAFEDEQWASPVQTHPGGDQWVVYSLPLALFSEDLLSNPGCAPACHLAGNNTPDNSGGGYRRFGIQVTSGIGNVIYIDDIYFPSLASQSQTPTPTFTQVDTYTITPSPSSSSTATVTPTLTPAFSETLTQSVTVTPSGTMTLSATPTPSQQPSAPAGNNGPPASADEDDAYVYPNPVEGPACNFVYRMKRPGEANIIIYQVTGEPAAVVRDTHDTGGDKSTVADMQGIAPGVYFFVVERQYGDSASERTRLQKFLRTMR
jgi:hypothetical protein